MNLKQAIVDAVGEMRIHGQPVHTERWQAMNIKNRPEAEMREVLHYRLDANLHGMESLEYYREHIEPNLPWADDHFKERICGLPINPGKEWENWPWSRSANSHRQAEKFNHNYMERYWPKFAGRVAEPTRTIRDFSTKVGDPEPHSGIYHEYGDLGDLIQLLAKEPMTRQAYFPIWFPEDTGITHEGRKPCTLGYHFIMRNGFLDIRYDIRSCDLYRHFRDDIYLTIRLGLYILDRCREINPSEWGHVVPGRFIMNITSLHMFINDYRVMFGEI